MKQSTDKQLVTIAIYADDKKGILGHILMIFNRPGYDISQLNVARTDVQDIILINIHAMVPQDQLKIVLYKIEKIVEVYRAVSFETHQNGLQKVAHYRLDNQQFNSDTLQVLQKYGAVITERLDNSFVIQKSGYDKDIDELYNLLDGQHLLGFCKSGLMVSESLISFDEFFA